MNCSIGGIRLVLTFMNIYESFMVKYLQRMLDGRISDTLEGRALSHALDKVRRQHNAVE